MVELLLGKLLVSPLSARFDAKRETSACSKGVGQRFNTSDISSVTWNGSGRNYLPFRAKFSIAEPSENGNS